MKSSKQGQGSAELIPINHKEICMNKKLLALAIAAAIAPAAAMADTGNVTVYGVLDASYDITDNGDSAAGVAGTRTNKVSSNSSRLGFKGTEDLGNGTSAVWQIESTINMDGNGLTSSATGGTTFGGRNTFIGLSNKNMGTVLFGRHDTPYKLATRSIDYFGDGLADNRNLMGQGAASFDGRQSDVVAYISPTVNGLHAAVAYVAGAESAAASADKKGNAWSLMGMYNNGPLMVSLAYERHNVGASSVDADESEKAWKLGASYNFGALDVGFAYEKTSDDFGKSGLACPSGSTTTDCFGHKAWTIGGKYKMGSNDIKLAYIRAGDMGNTSNTSAKQWALGLDHHMSKRTKVYAQYVKLDNDNGIAYDLSGASATGSVSAVGNGADPSAWSFGIRHTF
jgi:predicted porin